MISTGVVEVIRQNIRRCWSQSKRYRRILTIAVIFTALRLLLHLMLLAGTLMPGEDAASALPDDLRIYLEAAENLQQQRDLYPPLPLERMEFYQYAPAFALAFRPFLWLPVPLTAFVQTVLHLTAYAVLYVMWGRIFQRLKLEHGVEALTWTLPVWLVFAAFWSDLTYLNVYILMALAATLLIDAVISENLGASLLWLAIILQTKPQWAFALAVPLLLGHYRFFFKLLVGSFVAYVVIAGATMLLVGLSYGLEQYTDYFRLLTGIGGNYPWRTPEMPFLGYNHSIAQTLVYLFGNTLDALRLATLVKALILLPLGVLGLRCLLRPPRDNTSTFKLDLAFALYVAAFIWLDVVWELSLSIAVFTYLLATTQGRSRTLIWAVFLPYALVDAWQIVSFMVFGPDILAPGPYVLTDPSIYLPLTMILAIVFYGLLVKRLWASVTQPVSHLSSENLDPDSLSLKELS
jgi:hypothetical protein